MKSTGSSNRVELEDKAFLWLIVVISALFLWTIRPLYGSVLWAIVTAILFSPLYRKLCGVLRQRRNIAAIATLLIVVIIVIIPLTVLITALVAEAAVVSDRIQS